MNQAQQAYVASLNYPYEGTVKHLDGVKLDSKFVESLQEVVTVGDLMRKIRQAHCFGLKDTLVLALLHRD